MWKDILIICISIIFSFMLTSSGLFAEHDIKEQEEWNPVSAGPITTWTAPLCEKREFVIQPFFFYNRARGTFNSEGHHESLPKGDKKYQYQQQLFMQYGLTDRLEIDGQLVYQENFIKQGDLKAHSRGFGEISPRFVAEKDARLTQMSRETLLRSSAEKQLNSPTEKVEVKS